MAVRRLGPSLGGVTPKIGQQFEIDFQWPTFDPFLFCVHHDDAYPEGNEGLGPAESLLGRNLGNDFDGIDGWRMYHGSSIPGFPKHPHRGFETVTFVRRGLVDHADSMGAAGRYGRGDVQWMTAGGGVQHSEMFPLLDSTGSNHLELFQIWVNLPSEDKMVPPHFSMFWEPEVPKLDVRDEGGGRTIVEVVAGRLEGAQPPSPPPNSWASREESDLAIWHLRMETGAVYELPPARGGETVRTLYFYEGESLTVGSDELSASTGLVVDATTPTLLRAGSDGASVLVLQGRPIGEPVARYGPFVMNTRAEIVRAIRDYEETDFGGWPWERSDQVHGRDPARFARHADGREEGPSSPFTQAGEKKGPAGRS